MQTPLTAKGKACKLCIAKGGRCFKHGGSPSGETLRVSPKRNSPSKAPPSKASPKRTLGVVLEDLPCEMLLIIAKNLDPFDYATFSSVSRKIQRCIKTGRYKGEVVKEVERIFAEKKIERERELEKAKSYDYKITKDTPEILQLKAIKRKHGFVALREIIEAGIVPSEKVQLAGVKNFGNAIYHIIQAGIVPSEQVQLAAVKTDGYAIYDIIRAGIVPSEQVQLAAVTQQGDAIGPIIKAGIVPSEQVQLAAVTQRGNVIIYIIQAGIVPSEQVKTASRRKNRR